MLVRTWKNSDRNPAYINDTIHWTTPRHQTVLTQNCPETLKSPQYFGLHKVQKSQFHTEAPRMSDATVQNSVARRPSAPDLCAPRQPTQISIRLISFHETHVLTAFVNTLLFCCKYSWERALLTGSGGGGAAETLRLLWFIGGVKLRHSQLWSRIGNSAKKSLVKKYVME